MLPPHMDAPPLSQILSPNPSRLRSLADALEADGWTDLAQDVRQAVLALEAAGRTEPVEPVGPAGQ